MPGSVTPLPPPFRSIRSGACPSSPWGPSSPLWMLTLLAGGFCEHSVLAHRDMCWLSESVWNILSWSLAIVLQGTGAFEGAGWTEEWPQRPPWFLTSQTPAPAVLRRESFVVPGREDKVILFPRLEDTAHCNSKNALKNSFLISKSENLK